MIGTQIGPLTITRQLGQGGMGAVYLARHMVLDKLFVIKILLPHWSHDQAMVQRFVNEARAASSIEHPSIIEIGDCGQTADGRWYIVMKYLDGGTLDVFMRSHGPIGMHLALQVLAPAADALQEAHDREIIHCDLKPENIYLTQKGSNPHHATVLDFGIARMSEERSGLHTAPGMIAGTLAYMAPEQILDRRKVDRRSDVYALAVILYQMVTGGWLPYQRSDAPDEFFELAPTAMYQRQKETPPIDPRQRGAQISDRFAHAILAALHFDPERRPSSMRAFFALLAPAVPGDSYQPSGVEIVTLYAPNLLKAGNLNETLRGPKPVANSAPDRYQLGPLLGKGGMAEVYLGTMTGAEGVERLVAIKRILPEFSTHAPFAEMFVREAKLVSRLNHVNIVTVIDFDRDAENRLRLVLELVEGVDLNTLLESGPIPHGVVIFLFHEILCGLGYAHNLPDASAGAGMLGLVHRDMSPHNVLLSWDGAVKVSDFGLAKSRDTSEASASIQLRGKVAFMSPEQINGHPLDGRSDLFAVGVMAWEILTGQRLFWHSDWSTTIANVLQRPIPAPSVVRPVPRVPRDLEAIVMRLLERNPAMRYATAGEVKEAFEACADASARGRSQLVSLLAERFPHARRAPRPEIKTTRPAPNQDSTRSMPAPRPASPSRPTPQQAHTPSPPQNLAPTPIVAPQPHPAPTSVSIAASEVVATGASPPAHRGRWFAVAIAAGLAGAAGGALVVGHVLRERTSAESATNATHPAGGESAPSTAELRRAAHSQPIADVPVLLDAGVTDAPMPIVASPQTAPRPTAISPTPTPTPAVTTAKPVAPRAASRPVSGESALVKEPARIPVPQKSRTERVLERPPNTHDVGDVGGD